ncbi:MAG: hypothetical protein RBR41_03380 [Desulfovibrio sp.]|nr:hypothetical protein [Desulfovibrio sp.]MDY0258694.1 hypothetical protein [Desulfovibrio sp.]
MSEASLTDYCGQKKSFFNPAASVGKSGFYHAKGMRDSGGGVLNKGSTD